MNTSIQNIVTKGTIGLVFGLLSTLGVSGSASAASDYKVIADHKINVGDWKNHEPAQVVRFHMPRNFDASKPVVLQMNIRSTNKSKYNAIYLNDFSVDEYAGCDPVDHDTNAHARVDFLPVVPHNQWRVYHNAIDGRKLQPGDNYLLICSRNQHGEGSYNVDNFYVKDIVVHYRETQPRPEFCPANFEPVCGVDGNSYNNACEAERAGVEIHHGGNCEGSGNTPPPGI